MQHSHPCRPYPCPPPFPGAVANAGLLGVFGGVVNLATAALQGGACLVRHVVEGTVWHAGHGACGCHGPHGASCCGGHAHGCCHVMHLPHEYPACHRCC